MEKDSKYKGINLSLYNSITKYAENPDPQYAIMISGEWGCGKTCFIKKWKSDYIEGKLYGGDETEVTLKPIYVSLYGMEELSEIRTAMDREINPFLYSKTGKALVGVSKIIGRMALRTEIDFTGDGTPDASFSGTLDSLSLLMSDSNDIRGDKFIIFDDFERCLISIQSLLGLINYFVEHCSCHVVIICDEEHIPEGKKKTYNDFKEKTIGQTMRIKPEYDAALEAYLNEVPNSPYLNDKKNLIKECFSATGYNNLRVLRQSLYDFKMLLKDFDDETINDNELIFQNLLSSFIVIYAEYHKLDDKELFRKWTNKYVVSINVDSKATAEKETISRLQKKYQKISEQCIYQVFYPDFVASITSFIETGKPVTSCLNSLIEKNAAKQTPWERLASFRDMSNEEFDEVYYASIESLSKAEISQSYQIGVLVGWIGFFDSFDIKHCSEDDVKLVKNCLNQLFQKVQSKDQLYGFRAAFIQGVNYVRYNGVKSNVIDDILDFFENVFKQKDLSMTNLMEDTLLNMKDDNVDSLIAIDDMAVSSRQFSYQQDTIFTNVDAEKLWNNIEGLTNKGRQVFCGFLEKHYLLGLSDGTDNRYEADVPVLKALKEHVEKKITETTSVERYGYERLKDNLNRSINRCNGASKA